MDGVEPVQLVIQDAGTKLYLNREAGWISDASSAMTFERASEAVAYVHSRQLNSDGIRVIWKSKLRGCDWVLWPAGAGSHADTPERLASR